MSDLSEAPLPELLEALEQRGVTVKLDNGALKVRGWTKVSPAERERLRTERDALVKLLREDEETIDPPAPKKSFGVWMPPTERHARFRKAGPSNLTEKGEDVYAAVIEDVPEDEMSSAEIKLARRAFARRFGLPYERR